MKPDQFLAKKPYYLGRVSGVNCYEHPIYGEEAGIIVIFDDKVYETDCEEMPDMDEMEYIKQEILDLK